MKDIYNVLEENNSAVDYIYLYEKENESEKQVEDDEMKNIDDEDLLNYFNDNPNELKKFLKGIHDSDEIDEKDKEKLLKKLKKLKSSTNNVNEDEINEVLGFAATMFAVAGSAYVTKHALNKVYKGVQKKQQADVQNFEKAIEEETDPEKKKQMQDDLDKYKTASRYKDGRGPLLVSHRSMKKYIKYLRKTGKVADDYSYNSYRDFKDQVKEVNKKFKEREKEEPKEEPKEETKEETVKDKSGIEWIKRKKERGTGFTYCKKDDRSVTISQNEYNKRNASKSKNESQHSSLKDYLIESLS